MELNASQYQKLFGLIQPLLKDKNIELVDLKLISRDESTVFEVSVDTDDGITADECAKASRSISLLIDVEDPFPFKFDLEVGSPGIFRELRTDQQLKKHLNMRVKVLTQCDDQVQNEFVGQLLSFDDTCISIVMEGDEKKFSRNNLKQICLFPDLF